MEGEYLGDKVQIDIKYIPDECIRFSSYGSKYYQITGIDEYSRKRVLKVVKEKSTYETKKYVLELEKQMGFQIKTIQVDNGSEFVNDEERTDRKSGFEKVERVIELKLGKLLVLENISEVECDG